MHKTSKKMSLRYQTHGFTGKFSNFEAIIEIASLRVCARVRIGFKKIVDIQTAKS